MSTYIAGLGSWLPKAVRRNDAWPASFAARDHLAGDRTFNDIPPSEDLESAAILERHLASEAHDPFLGAIQRHVAEPSCTTGDAETLAAQNALADAGIDAAAVDVILSNAAVPERIVPSAAVNVAHRIGAVRALAQGIDSACATSITQLEVARAYIESGLANVVLLTQSHLMVRTLSLSHPASPGLGDAATAIVVTRERGGLKVRSTFGITHGEYADAVTWLRGMTEDADLPWWTAGGDLRLGSRNPIAVKVLMRETVSFGAQTVREAAARAKTDIERIRLIASVQPRGFIPGAIAERLGLPFSSAITTYEKIAHVGACGPVFNLLAARKEKAFSSGATIALYGQGAGFTRAAAILEVS